MCLAFLTSMFHITPMRVIVSMCVCVCTRVLCTVYTETLNAPLSKFSRQGHYILHLATSHCVEKGWLSCPEPPTPFQTHTLSCSITYYHRKYVQLPSHSALLGRGIQQRY